MFYKKVGNQEGFTLIELVIVVAIIGVLGAMVMPKFGGFKEVAADNADKATAIVLANAAKLHYLDGKIEFDTGNDKEIEVSVLKEADLLEEGECKPQKSGEEDFVITIDKKGNVTVTYSGSDGKKLYPAE